MARIMKPSRIQVCPQCAKSFSAYASNDRTFCSKKCYTEAHHKTVICAGCDKKFDAKISARSRGKQNFCSHECYLDHKTKNRIVFEFACDQCGVRYTRLRNQIAVHNGHRFCSQKCVNTWNKTNTPTGEHHPHFGSVEVSCATCGNLLIRNPYRLRDYEEQYCNRKCAGKSRNRRYSGPNNSKWKGGYQPGYRGPNWEIQAAAARKRDGYHCQKCGMSQKKVGRKLDVHHIIPFRDFKYIPDENDNYIQANQLTNLTSLCPRCHQLVEKGSLAVQMMLLSIE